MASYICRETFEIKNWEYKRRVVKNHFHVDDSIALAIQALNRKGYITVACCSGHPTSLICYILFKEGIWLPSLPPGFVLNKESNGGSLWCIISRYGENDKYSETDIDKNIREIRREIHERMEQLHKWALYLPEFRDLRYNWL